MHLFHVGSASNYLIDVVTSEKAPPRFVDVWHEAEAVAQGVWKLQVVKTKPVLLKMRRYAPYQSADVQERLQQNTFRVSLCLLNAGQQACNNELVTYQPACHP